MSAKDKGLTRRTFVKAAGISGAALATGLGPFRGTSMSAAPKKRVLVLGIDGLDPKMCARLIKAGRMPNLAALSKTGHFSPLTTVNPPQSPVAWSGIATGSNPGVHGIYDFIIRNPKNYLPDLSLIRLGGSKFGFGGPSYVNPVKSQAFWDVTARAGVKSTVVRWPVTFPAKDSKAKLYSGLGTPDIKGTLGRSTYFAEGSAADVGHSRGDVIEIKFSGDTAKIEVSGPYTGGFGKRSSAKVKLTVTRSGGKLHFKGERNEFSLAAGEWSDWQRFKFSLGLRGSVTGIAQFHLTSADPVGLYLTPVQIDPNDPSMPFTEPEEYAAELTKVVGGPYATLGMPEDTKALSENWIPDEAFMEMCLDINSDRLKMFDYELDRFDEGLLAFVFDTSDRIQHMFYRLAHPDHPLYDAKLAKTMGSAIDDHYSAMDKVIGQANMAMGDDGLIVCSDHGFGSYTRSVNLNTWLAKEGYLSLKDHDPADTGELFRHVDWKKTKAYALGFGSVYLNLDGREDKGQVKPGAPARELADEIGQRLMTLKDNSTPVVRQVHHKANLYSGPQTEDAPELVIGYHLPYRVSWTTAIGGAGQEIIEDNDQKWAGDHCVDADLVPGIVASNQRFNNPTPNQTQLASTVLNLLGVKPGGNMEEGLV